MGERGFALLYHMVKPSRFTDSLVTWMDMALVVRAEEEEVWYCHCCTAKNTPSGKKCRVCGRDESYGQFGYPLPFHGNNAKIYRPGQLFDVMDDIHATDSENWTALHVACANGNIAMVSELLHFKAQIEAITNKGQTALHLAVYSGSLECVQTLLKHAAKVRVVTYTERQSPLHMACEKGFAKITQLLIAGGADIDGRNIMERTPLHCAAVVGRTDIALLLLRAGAMLKPLDAHGWDPCQIAELFGHRDLQELLIREGMTEKQAVMKELPPAPWHSEVWFDVIKMQTQRRLDHERVQQAAREDEDRLKAMREGMKQRQVQDRRTERQLEIQKFQSAKTAYELAYKRK